MLLYDIAYNLRDGLGGYSRVRSLHLESDFQDEALRHQVEDEIEKHETKYAPNPQWAQNLRRRIYIIAIAPCEGHEEDADEE